MARTYYRSNADSVNPDDGQLVFHKQLVDAVSTSVSQTISIPGGATRLGHAGTQAPEPGITGPLVGDYQVDLSVIEGHANINVSVALARVNADSEVQTQSGWSSPIAGQSGTNTFTFPNLDLGTWEATHRLRCIYRFVNTNSMNSRNITVAHGSVANQVVAPFPADNGDPVGVVWRDEFDYPNGPLPLTDGTTERRWMPKARWQMDEDPDTGYHDFAGNSYNRNPNGTDDTPFTVQDGVLRIEAIGTPITVEGDTSPWQGGMLVSNPAFSEPGRWTYGYMEWRARYPQPGVGMFPALWMFASQAANQPTGKECAEIDAFEVFGHAAGEPWTNTMHLRGGAECETGSQVSGSVSFEDTSDWHRYGIEWTPTVIRVYRDGVLRQEWDGADAEWFQGSELDVRCNVSMAADGDPDWFPSGNYADGTTPDPMVAEIDYVRVYDAAPDPLPTGSQDPEAGAEPVEVALRHGLALTHQGTAAMGGAEPGEAALRHGLALTHQGTAMGTVPMPAGVPQVTEFTSASLFDDSSDATTTLLIDRPSGVGAGDLLLAAIRGESWDGGITGFSAPGWEVIVAEDTGTHRRTWLYLVADGSEPAEFTFTLDGQAGNEVVLAGMVLRIEGADPIDPINASSSTTGTTAPSITTDVENCLLLFSLSHAANGVSAWTWPPPMVQVAMVQRQFAAVGVAAEPVEDAGPSGDRTGSYTNSFGAGTAGLLAIAPTTSAPPEPGTATARHGLLVGHQAQAVSAVGGDLAAGELVWVTSSDQLGKPHRLPWFAHGHWWAVLRSTSQGQPGWRVWRREPDGTWTAGSEQLSTTGGDRFDCYLHDDGNVYVGHASATVADAQVHRLVYNAGSNWFEIDASASCQIDWSSNREVSVTVDGQGRMFVGGEGQLAVHGISDLAELDYQPGRFAGAASESIVATRFGDSVGFIYAASGDGEFAVHADSDPLGDWTVETFASDVDDHTATAVDGGRVIACWKDDRDRIGEPMVLVAARETDGTWGDPVGVFDGVSTSSAENHTRPRVAIDATNRQVHVAAASASGSLGVQVDVRVADADTLGFGPSSLLFFDPADEYRFRDVHAGQFAHTAESGLLWFARGRDEQGAGSSSLWQHLIAIDADLSATVAVAHGLTVGHGGDAARGVTAAALAHGLTVGHGGDAVRGASTVAVAHGLRLGARGEAFFGSDLSIHFRHGLAVRAGGTATRGASGATLRHGLTLRAGGTATRDASGATARHGVRVTAGGSVTRGASGATARHGLAVRAGGTATRGASGAALRHGVRASASASAARLASGATLRHGLVFGAVTTYEVLFGLGPTGDTTWPAEFRIDARMRTTWWNGPGDFVWQDAGWKAAVEGWYQDGFAHQLIIYPNVHNQAIEDGELGTWSTVHGDAYGFRYPILDFSDADIDQLADLYVSASGPLYVCCFSEYETYPYQNPEGSDFATNANYFEALLDTYERVRARFQALAATRGADVFVSFGPTGGYMHNHAPNVQDWLTNFARGLNQSDFQCFQAMSEPVLTAIEVMVPEMNVWPGPVMQAHFWSYEDDGSFPTADVNVATIFGDAAWLQARIRDGLFAFGTMGPEFIVASQARIDTVLAGQETFGTAQLIPDQLGVQELPAPTGLQGVADGTDRIDWSWNPVTGAVRYEIEGNGGWWYTDVGANTTYTSADHSPEQTVSLRVRGYDAHDVPGAWSGSVAVTTDPAAIAVEATVAHGLRAGGAVTASATLTGTPRHGLRASASASASRGPSVVTGRAGLVVAGWVQLRSRVVAAARHGLTVGHALGAHRAGQIVSVRRLMTVGHRAEAFAGSDLAVHVQHGLTVGTAGAARRGRSTVAAEHGLTLRAAGTGFVGTNVVGALRHGLTVGHASDAEVIAVPPTVTLVSGLYAGAVGSVTVTIPAAEVTVSHGLVVRHRAAASSQTVVLWFIADAVVDLPSLDTVLDLPSLTSDTVVPVLGAEAFVPELATVVDVPDLVAVAQLPELDTMADLPALTTDVQLPSLDTVQTLVDK